jgi:hypothetical protein
LPAGVPELLQQWEDVNKFPRAAVSFDHGFVWSCELVDELIK